MNILSKFKNSIIQLLKSKLSNKKIEKEIINIEPVIERDERFICKILGDADIIENLVYQEEQYDLSEEDLSFNSLHFKEIYETIVSPENFFSKDKKHILDKMWLDSYSIYKALLPLEELGIKSGLDITGGAVRDFLLNKPMKDLDLCLYINIGDTIDNCGYENLDIADAHIHTRNKIKENIKNFFTPEEILNGNFSENEELLDTINKIVLLCMKKTKDLTSEKLYSNNERFVDNPDSNYGPDMVNMMTSLIKTGGKNTHYPIDLIVTDRLRYELINNIDFNICKVGFCLTHCKDAFSNTVYFPSTPEIFIQRIYSNVEFWEDAAHKTISFNPENKTIEQIMFSFDERLNRIMKKYEDYKIQIVSPNSLLYEDAKKILFKTQLENKIEKHIDRKPIKRAKV